MADEGRTHYRALVYEDPGFQAYFEQASPIEEIAQLNTGSRPVSRGGTLRIADLRAIPWVFAWMQNRHLLPAWYGVGYAVEQYARRQGGLECLRDMYQRWRFFRSLVDNLQMVLVKADMRIAHHYARLVTDARERDRLFSVIDEEFRRTHDIVLQVTDQRSILEQQPQLLASLRLRDPYIDPMSYLQVRPAARAAGASAGRSGAPSAGGHAPNHQRDRRRAPEHRLKLRLSPPRGLQNRRRDSTEWTWVDASHVRGAIRRSLIPLITSG